MRIYTFKAQILVTSLIIITIITLTIVGVTLTVQRSAQRTSSNLTYETNYAISADLLTTNIAAFSDQTLQTSEDFEQVLGDEPGFSSCDLDSSSISNDQLLCVFTDEIEGTRSLVKIYNSNQVNNLQLSSGESFDVILSQGGQSNNNFEIRWTGNSAFDLQLLAENSGELTMSQLVVDPQDTGTYSRNMSISGTEISTSFNRETDVLNSLDVEVDVAGKKLLRITSVSRQTSVNLDIRPLGNSNFPDQVRVVEAITYNPTQTLTSSAVVLTQIPISQSVPAPLYNSLSLNAFRSPICGNGVVEGSESCDDGNTIETDGCLNNCTAIFNQRYDFNMAPNSCGELNEDRKSSHANGYNSQSFTYKLPFQRVPDDLKITSVREEQILFDDHILLVINGIIVATSDPQMRVIAPTTNITIDGQTYQYPIYNGPQQWSGQRMTLGGAPNTSNVYKFFQENREEADYKCWKLLSKCVLPSTQQQGVFDIEFNEITNKILAQKIKGNNYEIDITLVVFGDDDFGGLWEPQQVDCQANISLEITGNY